MKISGQCPKCSSKEVVQLAGQSFGDKVYPAGGQYSTVVKYACTDCGYVETYLADSNELELLKRNPRGLDS
jgi:predicted nucleic-acid-binding Zn-ribbon protein